MWFRTVFWGRQLSRFSELIENLKNCHPDDWWLSCFDKLPEVDDLGIFEHHINVYEQALQKLDDNAWSDFRAKTLHLFKQDTANRGKQQFFNQLNEAFAYEFLSNLGCSKIKFLPENKVKTPDLSFEFDGQQGLCEVKTISKSDDQITLETSGEVYSSNKHSELQPEFFKKLKDHIANAFGKFICHPSSVRNITYFIVHLDDGLMAGIYFSKYRSQILEFLECNYSQCEFYFQFNFEDLGGFNRKNDLQFPLHGTTL